MIDDGLKVELGGRGAILALNGTRISRTLEGLHISCFPNLGTGNWCWVWGRSAHPAQVAGYYSPEASPIGSVKAARSGEPREMDLLGKAQKRH